MPEEYSGLKHIDHFEDFKTINKPLKSSFFLLTTNQ